MAAVKKKATKKKEKVKDSKEPKAPKPLNFFDVLNAINFTKKDILRDENVDEKERNKAYVPYMINKGLSFFVDTILYANEMNMAGHLPDVMQQDYYLHSIRPRKRFSQWFKPENSENVNAVSEFFGYSHDKAVQALSLLSEEDVNNIKIKLEKGGKK